MKKEVELKFFVDTIAPIRQRLKKLGAKFEWKGKEKDLLLDNPSQLIKKRHGTLRLRDSYAKVLTYKELRGDEHKRFKVRDEYEVEVDDVKTLEFILGRLGYRQWFAYTKQYREYWRYKDVSVSLDIYPFGNFVEIEAPPKKIDAFARKLSLDFSRATNKSYIVLLREYERNKLKDLKN